MLSEAGCSSSRSGLLLMYCSARAASSSPDATARRNAAMPNVCTDIHSFSARAARVSCRPRSAKFGWFEPHTVSWMTSCRSAKGRSSVRRSFTSRQPASYDWKNHLWASRPMESARSIPASCRRPVSVTTAKPP